MPRQTVDRQKMPRGQIELWMLTKFGMLFFIVGLFAIIYMYQVGQVKSICTGQANGIAQGIGNRVAQVFESASEDEARAYVIEPALLLGKDKSARYNANITLLSSTAADKLGSGRIVVEVSPVTGECSGGASVPYSNAASVELEGSVGAVDSVGGAQERRVMKLAPFCDPATLFSTGTCDRSYYLRILKCGTKSFPPQTHLFIQDCHRTDINNCLDFTSPKVVCACGWDYEKNNPSLVPGGCGG